MHINVCSDIHAIGFTSPQNISYGDQLMSGNVNDAAKKKVYLCNSDSCLDALLMTRSLSH